MGSIISVFVIHFTLFGTSNIITIAPKFSNTKSTLLFEIVNDRKLSRGVKALLLEICKLTNYINNKKDFDSFIFEDFVKAK